MFGLPQVMVEGRKLSQHLCTSGWLHTRRVLWGSSTNELHKSYSGHSWGSLSASKPNWRKAGVGRANVGFWRFFSPSEIYHYTEERRATTWNADYYVPVGSVFQQLFSVLHFAVPLQLKWSTLVQYSLSGAAADFLATLPLIPTPLVLLCCSDRTAFKYLWSMEQTSSVHV